MPADVDLFNLLFGSGIYTTPARLRADDLLIRGHADQSLTAVTTRLRDTAAAYQREMVPPATREHPFPDAAVMAPMRRADQARNAVNAVKDAIRGLPLPA